jgi:hypothetical protein
MEVCKRGQASGYNEKVDVWIVFGENDENCVPQPINEQVQKRLYTTLHGGDYSGVLQEILDARNVAIDCTRYKSLRELELIVKLFVGIDKTFFIFASNHSTCKRALKNVQRFTREKSWYNDSWKEFVELEETIESIWGDQSTTQHILQKVSSSEGRAMGTHVKRALLNDRRLVTTFLPVWTAFNDAYGDDLEPIRLVDGEMYRVEYNRQEEMTTYVVMHESSVYFKIVLSNGIDADTFHSYILMDYLDTKRCTRFHLRMPDALPVPDSLRIAMERKGFSFTQAGDNVWDVKKKGGKKRRRE